MIRRLMERIRGRWLEYQLRTGRKVYGRQGPPKQGATPSGGVAVSGRGTVTVAAVITRADGRVEDLGIIARGET